MWAWALVPKLSLMAPQGQGKTWICPRLGGVPGGSPSFVTWEDGAFHICGWHNPSTPRSSPEAVALASPLRFLGL